VKIALLITTPQMPNKLPVQNIEIHLTSNGTLQKSFHSPLWNNLQRGNRFSPLKSINQPEIFVYKKTTS